MKATTPSCGSVANALSVTVAGMPSLISAISASATSATTQTRAWSAMRKSSSPAATRWPSITFFSTMSPVAGDAQSMVRGLVMVVRTSSMRLSGTSRLRNFCMAPARLLSASDFGRAALRAHGHHEVGLRQLNLRAVEAEQRLALFDVLPGLVDEQLLDVAVRAHGHDRKQRLVVLDGADPAHGTGDGQGLDLLGPHPRCAGSCRG